MLINVGKSYSESARSNDITPFLSDKNTQLTVLHI